MLPAGPTPHGAASGNGTPTDPLPIVRYDAFFGRIPDMDVSGCK
jgi:hypothetical protein